MKKAISIGLVVVMALSLCACGTGAAQSNESSAQPTSQATMSTENSAPVTLRFSWWGGDARHQATLNAIDAYQKANPSVTIEAEYSSFSGYYEKLVTQIASGNAPDFFQVDQGWVAELSARGNTFADMNQFSNVMDFSTFSETMMQDYCNINEEISVLPFGYNGTIFLYNKTLLADWCDADGKLQMKTWDDFNRIGQELRAKDPEAYMTTSITDGYLRYMLKPMLEQYTSEIDIQDDLTLGFAKEDLQKTFESFMQFFEKGVSQPYEEALLYDSFQNNPLWLNGKIGGLFIFFSNIDTEIVGLDYDFEVAGLPMFREATLSGQESCPSLMVAINKNTDAAKQVAAAQFLNWFLNDPEAAKILGTVRGVPGSSAALQTLKDNSLLSDLMAKGVEISDSTLSLKNGAYELNATVKAVYVDYMEKVIYKVLTPAQAAEQMCADLEKVLADLAAANYSRVGE